MRQLCLDRDVRLQPWHDRDLTLARELVDRVGPAVIVRKPASLFGAAARYAHDELVVSMRLHATIAAASAGARSLSIGHHTSMVSLAERLDQSVLTAGTAPDEIDRLAHEALSRPLSDVAIRTETESATKSMALLRMLIHLGDVDDLADVDGLPLLPEGAIC
jgi:polysaccharide pyruvyl transferase WcaK-like protein